MTDCIYTHACAWNCLLSSIVPGDWPIRKHCSHLRCILTGDWSTGTWRLQGVGLQFRPPPLERSCDLSTTTDSRVAQAEGVVEGGEHTTIVKGRDTACVCVYLCVQTLPPSHWRAEDEHRQGEAHSRSPSVSTRSHYSKELTSPTRYYIMKAITRNRYNGISWSRSQALHIFITSDLLP